MNILDIIIGSVVIITLGCLFHFVYNFCHHDKFIGLFVAVNESTWEHIKIAIIPSVIWCLYDVPLFGDNPNYFSAKFFSLLSLIISIPFLFYLYKIFTKKAILPIDILIFCICIIFSQTVFYSLLSVSQFSNTLNIVSLFGIFIIVICCPLFTIFPPKIFLFKDPVTGKYGYVDHKNHPHAHKHE